MLGAMGCSDNKGGKGSAALPPIAPFSSQRLHDKLEALRRAFEEKGMTVSDTLLPGLSEPEIRSACDWFPASLPEELIALYAWRNGQQESAARNAFPFWFRDCAFIPLATAKTEYASMMSTYGAHPSDAPLLKNSFPFAAFNGGWLLLPCAPQALEPRLARPIIFVMQDISIHFYSIELMVDTQTEWVSHPSYHAPGLSEADEMQIWRRHNPGIYASHG